MNTTLRNAINTVLGYGAEPPEYPGLVLVPKVDIDRLRAVVGPLCGSTLPHWPHPFATTSELQQDECGGWPVVPEGTCRVPGCPCGATTEDEHDTRDAE